MKDYQPAHGGVLMDASFTDHQSRCERCKPYYNGAPLAGLCLEGSVLLKREAEKTARKRIRPERSEFRGTKDAVQRAMKYK